MVTGAREPAPQLRLNDIGSVLLRTAEPLVVDPYRVSRRTGGLLLVDELSGSTAGAGMVDQPEPSPGGRT